MEGGVTVDFGGRRGKETDHGRVGGRGRAVARAGGRVYGLGQGVMRKLKGEFLIVFSQKSVQSRANVGFLCACVCVCVITLVWQQAIWLRYLSGRKMFGQMPFMVQCMTDVFGPGRCLFAHYACLPQPTRCLSRLMLMLS